MLQMSLLSLLRFARMQARHGWRYNTRPMSDAVIPVLRQVVVSAMHMRSAGRCPVRRWKRPTRVVVLRGGSWSLALRVS